MSFGAIVLLRLCGKGDGSILLRADTKRLSIGSSKVSDIESIYMCLSSSRQALPCHSQIPHAVMFSMISYGEVV